jgi:hypothetical protein
VAEELREYMAKLGVRTVDELVGRTDLLRVKPPPQAAAQRAGSAPHPGQPADRKQQRALCAGGRLQLPSGKHARHARADEEVQKELGSKPKPQTVS